MTKIKKLTMEEFEAIIDSKVNEKLALLKEEQEQQVEIEIDETDTEVEEDTTDSEEDITTQSLLAEIEKLKEENIKWKEMFNKKQPEEEKKITKRPGW